MLKTLFMLAALCAPTFADTTIHRQIAGPAGTTITVQNLRTGITLVAESGNQQNATAAPDGHFTAEWTTMHGAIKIRVDKTQGPGETDDAFAARCKNAVRAQANQFPPDPPPQQHDSLDVAVPGGSAHQTGGAGEAGWDSEGAHDWASAWNTREGHPAEVISVGLSAEEQSDESDDEFGVRCSQKLVAFLPYFAPV